MSVRELKTALEELGVSFAGLLEKSEFGKEQNIVKPNFSEGNVKLFPLNLLALNVIRIY
jgi:hypothetical protein